MLYQYSNWFRRPEVVCLGFVLIVLFFQQVKPGMVANTEYADVKVDLAQYQLRGPSITIEGVQDNASGLTYNPDTKTLFMIVNNPEKILELDTQGRTLRQIALNGFRDTEGIIYLGDNSFAVTEERDRKITFINISETTNRVDHLNALSFQYARGNDDNRGFEGLTYDFRYNFFYIANEKRPRKLLALPDPRLSSSRLNYQMLKDLEQPISGLSDLSGLHMDKNTGNLLILSQESQMIIETSLNGERISHLKLSSKQSGLPFDISQAEGITMDTQGRLYICSEPNLLFIFDKKEPPVHLPDVATPSIATVNRRIMDNDHSIKKLIL